MFSYNPYQQQFGQSAPTMPYSNNYGTRQEVVRVNGEGGARAYQLAPNSSILLLDETEPVIWLKTTDGTGYPNLVPYNITPRKVETISDLKSLEERIAKLEGMIINESNTSNVKSATTEQYRQPDQSNQKSDNRQKH